MGHEFTAGLEPGIWSSGVTREELQKCLTCLQKRNPHPQCPGENPIPLESNSTYSLNVQQECQIASTLAFLSATTDDCEKVMAVCIEDYHDSGGTTVRIASNSGDLTGIVNGFTRLAQILEETARKEISGSKSVRQLFRYIITLDFYRILSRLRSHHAKRSRKTVGKRALIALLHEVVFHKSLRRLPILEDLQNMVHKLDASFSELEKCSGPSAEKDKMLDILEDIVRQSYDLTSKIELGNAIEAYSGDPTLKTYLPIALGKLGRYYSASKELVHAARKHPVFQNIRVESFDVDKPNISARVHAEIKLLFFYEVNPNHTRPRCICSSKSCCYMCNLFFRLHGWFHVPRYHGTVYPKWTVPDWLDIPHERWSALANIMNELKASLDKEVQKAKKSKKRYPPPNESVVLPLGIWSPSNFSTSKLSISQSSTSTIRPAVDIVGQRDSKDRTLSGTELPLTPPITPTIPILGKTITYTDDDGMTTPRANSPTSENREASRTPELPCMCIRRSELPYRKTISGAGPLLRLQMDKVSFTFQFIRGFSGHISIDIVKNHSKKDQEQEVIDIREIPIAREMRVNCSHSSDELAIELQKDNKALVYFTFVWDENVNKAEVGSSEMLGA